MTAFIRRDSDEKNEEQNKVLQNHEQNAFDDFIRSLLKHRISSTIKIVFSAISSFVHETVSFFYHIIIRSSLECWLRILIQSIKSRELDALIIFIIESQVMNKTSYYALKLLCNTRQHSFFLQQRSWLVHRQLICDVRRLLMRFSLIFSSARRFRSSAFFFLQSSQ